ncbi:MAG: vanadium-dependent haloperoxidase, partial [Bacteroidetes bacterium]|nr:vanadium-dependent haloperoxidase [Bacteroidota bacterium]
MIKKFTLVLVIYLFFFSNVSAQTSVAHHWTEHLISAIQKDFARPTVHARNLFHTSIVMYDAWAAYEEDAEFYLLGKSFGNLNIVYQGVPKASNKLDAQNEAISFAVYRLLSHRFQSSPGALLTMANLNAFMDSLGYDRSNISKDYLNGGPAELGNYIADRMIAFGYQDGSNEINGYANIYYTPTQDPILVEQPGNPSMLDPNRWQAISLSFAVDQAGNVLTSDPPHLSPEWGNVLPFALGDSVKTVHSRNGNNYNVYHDPGSPALLDTTIQTELESMYKWSFAMVSIWQSHLDPNDTTIWDISPASLGNNTFYPTMFSDYENFYNFLEGGDVGQGYAINPVTNQPYAPQLVKRGDYTRVIAEFWADGLNSETPPGHWFNIYNEISQHPLYEKKWQGQGPVLSNLEYDVKAYLSLGGAMHDAAICAWGVKGWYDFVRPVSALRYMADKGQSSIDTLANYHPAGLPLVQGFIEIVGVGDSLAGTNNQNVGKIKLYTWKGPSYITNPNDTYAGVGWILAENWWPYQRPSFVTPPFAGYVSGHSTFSRAAAEVMTFITGNPYFPGGMSNFVALQNEFLEFEDGPSNTVILQWATYRDASDQCSLSRIWGGIHPPIDDINGRLIGIEIGEDVATLVSDLYSVSRPIADSLFASDTLLSLVDTNQLVHLELYFSEQMDTNVHPVLTFMNANHPLLHSLSLVQGEWLDTYSYKWTYTISNYQESLSQVIVQIKNAISQNGLVQNPKLFVNPFTIDKERPELSQLTSNTNLLNDSWLTPTSFFVDLSFSEACDTAIEPQLSFISSPAASNLSQDLINSAWLNPSLYRASFLLVDANESISGIAMEVEAVRDIAGNEMLSFVSNPFFDIETANPQLIEFTINDSILTQADLGTNSLVLNFTFNTAMDMTSGFGIDFVSTSNLANSLIANSSNSVWLDSLTLSLSYNLIDVNEEAYNIAINIEDIKDVHGNAISNPLLNDVFKLDTKQPVVLTSISNSTVISDNQVGNAGFSILLSYDEPMLASQKPILELLENGQLSSNVSYDVFSSSWLNGSEFEAKFNVVDNNVEMDSLSLSINFAKDLLGNAQNLELRNDWIDLDT